MLNIKIFWYKTYIWIEIEYFLNVKILKALKEIP